MSNVNVEIILNRASMILLIGAGLFFVYEGAVLIDTHRSNPQRVPEKVAVAGSLTIFLGVASLVFAALHVTFKGGGMSTLKNLSNKIAKK